MKSLSFMHTDLSIIIVSYNVKHYLYQCLDSIWRSARKAKLKVEVWVVDNASQDGSITHLQRLFAEHLLPTQEKARLHLVANQRNVGFGRANNQALSKCKGRYILFLNPDTILGESTLKNCWEEAERHDSLGAMGVQMLHTNGRMAYESRRGLPTPWTAFCRMSGLGTLFPRSRFFGHYYMRYLDENQATTIEIVSGAFMWCSRSALEECGGFDERFFMYGEDIDLSYRLLKAGYENRYLPTPILHYKGESTQKNSYRYVHVFYQAMLIFFRKHFPHSSRWLALPVGVAIVLQALVTLLRQKMKSGLRYLFPHRGHSNSSVCYVGSASTHAHLLEQQALWGLRLTCHQELPSLFSDQILAFSTEDFSYDRIFQLLKDSDHRAHIGTYFPNHNLLIMGNEVFT